MPPWSPPHWSRVGHAGASNADYLLHHPPRSHLAPVPRGSCMVFFKPGPFCSPVTAHTGFPALGPAPSPLVSQRPRSVVSVLSQHLPFSRVGFCPFPTRVLVEGTCQAPTVIENCSLYQGKLKNSRRFLKVAVGALLWAQRRSSLRNASGRPALPSCSPRSVTGLALVVSGEGEMILFFFPCIQ